MSQAAQRTLKFEIFRYNPEDPASKPHMQAFELQETPFMSLFIALNKLREEQDPTLQFDFVCRSAVCGSCGMMVNGRPALACKTLTSQLERTIRLHPLPAFRLVGDLAVDTGSWFRGMTERVQGWIEAKAPFDPDAVEERMDDEVARAIYERERCIECGCCVASCAVANTRPAFVAPAGLNRIARFMMDPRDRRKTGDWFEVFASDEGVFGCLGLMACQDVCPKELPLREVYAYLRRKSLTGILSRRAKPAT
ncbi:fumarate reductase iron-sulfur subunit [Thioalkalivibrio sp. XN8]|uniref:fumarate reductase iron-sulfur subunit n=1 Tax=Thioalkalivibrio sp. XN8 TaxID=2712863 RepID=UPI0013EB298A|nr:fumarate reductase iron-sulfur subunit [Thioalkalivibrio sp. XN8]NGP54694.1 fumarate reductase iron-sulfur subunit [Thioalkalivibrio sp. XN8]